MTRKLNVPSSDDVAKKWGEVTPGRSSYYEKNAPLAADVWESNTKASKKTYQASVTDPKISDRFYAGVNGKSGKYKRKVVDVGVARFGPGVSAAVDDMQSGVDPYLAILAALSIPDRGPRGSAANYDIVKKVGEPLHKKRLSLLGASA